MPILKNAKKALRRDNRRNAINKLVKDQMKAAVKEVREQKDAKLLPAAYRAIDRAAKKNLVNKNKAGHMKAQLVTFLKKVATGSTTKDTKPAKKTTKTAKPAAKKAPAKKSPAKKAAPKKTTKAKKSSK